MLALHARQHHVVLQSAAVRLGTKVVEAEVTLELVARVVGGAAVTTVRLAAGRVAQLGDQAAHFWKLVTYPGRQHRVAARDAKPGQCIGQGPVQGLVQQVGFEQLLQAGAADLEGTGQGRIGFFEQFRNQAAQFGDRLRAFAAERGEERAQITFECWSE